MGRNLPCFAQYMQTFHLLFPPEVDTSAINNPAVSACPCFLGRFSPPDTQRSLASLACTISAICSQLTHSESCDGHLVLDRVFILTFLRVFRKGELNLHLSSIFTRHDDGGKKEQKSSPKS